MLPTIPAGTTLADGKYKVIRLLGTGGMGAVYEAENTTTHKRVAVKCLRPGREPRADAGARLVREAKASARIRHPNVVDVYDVVRADDFVYLVMEYLEGEPLSERLARGPLALEQALALLMPVMRGVAAAHRQGVIHRDIKPANILLAREEDAPALVPKLLDFGVSKLDAQDGASVVLTRSGQIVGTPLYMPLEQLMGDKELDPRADVYALGVVLYEALTGQPPVRAGTLPELIVKLTTTTAAPPQTLRPELPAALGDAVLRALARDKEERTASVAELLRELEPFAGPAPPAPGAALERVPVVSGVATAPTMRQDARAASALGSEGGERRYRRRAPLWKRARFAGVLLLVGGIVAAISYARLRSPAPHARLSATPAAPALPSSDPRILQGTLPAGVDAAARSLQVRTPLSHEPAGESSPGPIEPARTPEARKTPMAAARRGQERARQRLASSPPDPHEPTPPPAPVPPPAEVPAAARYEERPASPLRIRIPDSAEF